MNRAALSLSLLVSMLASVPAWQSFSTGKWEGNALVVTTTHLKESYVRRNGVPRSDRATLVEYWSRHGSFLTLASVILDPVYLTEPFIRTTNWELSPTQVMEPYPYEVAEEVSRSEGVVPHHLPGTNPFLSEFAKKFGLPDRAARAGAETMYPEYVAVLKGRTVAAASSMSAPPSAPDLRQPSEGGIHVQKVQGNVYMLSSSGGNVAVQVGDEGVLLVDAGRADMTDRVLNEFTTTGYPVIALNDGGSIQGEIDALNQILRLAISAGKTEGGTYIVPGHGRLSDMADVAYYRDMVTIIRDRILDMKRKGMTVEQVKAAKPTRDYDGRWGSTTGPWTTDMFVDAVYLSVGESK